MDVLYSVRRRFFEIYDEELPDMKVDMMKHRNDIYKYLAATKYIREDSNFSNQFNQFITNILQLKLSLIDLFGEDDIFPNLIGYIYMMLTDEKSSWSDIIIITNYKSVALNRYITPFEFISTLFNFIDSIQNGVKNDTIVSLHESTKRRFDKLSDELSYDIKLMLVLYEFALSMIKIKDEEKKFESIFLKKVEELL
jgi:hypothetical protein